MDNLPPMPPDDEPDEVDLIPIPDDISGMLLCPYCGYTKLAGLMVRWRTTWLKCSECHVQLPDTPLIRKTLRGGDALV